MIVLLYYGGLLLGWRKIKMNIDTIFKWNLFKWNERLILMNILY